MNDSILSNARAKTLKQIRETIAPLYLDPVPTDETLRTWFDEAGVPRFKSNASAKRGGGPVWYSVAGVEKFFRSRMMGKVAA